MGGAGVPHLEKLLDDFSEEVGQGGRLGNGGVGSDGCSVLIALLAVCADEGIEQQRQPVPRKLPQHLHVAEGITSTAWQWSLPIHDNDSDHDNRTDDDDSRTETVTKMMISLPLQLGVCSSRPEGTAHCSLLFPLPHMPLQRVRDSANTAEQ